MHATGTDTRGGERMRAAVGTLERGVPPSAAAWPFPGPRYRSPRNRLPAVAAGHRCHSRQSRRTSRSPEGSGADRKRKDPAGQVWRAARRSSGVSPARLRSAWSSWPSDVWRAWRSGVVEGPDRRHRGRGTRRPAPSARPWSGHRRPPAGGQLLRPFPDPRVTAQRAITRCARRCRRTWPAFPSTTRLHQIRRPHLAVMTEAEGIRNLVGTGLVQLDGRPAPQCCLSRLLYLNGRSPSTRRGAAHLRRRHDRRLRRLRPLFGSAGKINADVPAGWARACRGSAS